MTNYFNGKVNTVITIQVASGVDFGPDDTTEECDVKTNAVRFLLESLPGKQGFWGKNGVWFTILDDVDTEDVYGEAIVEVVTDEVLV